MNIKNFFYFSLGFFFVLLLAPFCYAATWQQAVDDPGMYTYSNQSCSYYLAWTSGPDITQSNAIIMWRSPTTYSHNTYTYAQLDHDCIVLEPANCSNGTKDADETGIDCGGSCSDSCVTTCPDGSVLDSMTVDGQQVLYCKFTTASDNLGNCPLGYSPVKETNQFGDTVVTGCFYDGGLPMDSSADYAASNPPVSTAPEALISGSFNTVHFSDTPVTTDNGDGTSTVTQQSSTTNSDGSSSVTTTTTIINNSSGDTVSSTESTASTKAPEDTAENYNLQNISDGDFTGMGVTTDDVPDDPDISSWFNDQLNNNSIVSAITSINVSTANPVCSLSGTVFGSPVEFSMCGSMFTDAFQMMGYILLFLAGISSYFIVVGRG